MNHKRRAIIIGGGIGGMATAIALRQIGWEAYVYERAPEMREVGAGLSLWANAVRALDKLGLAASIRNLLPPAPSGGVYTEDGSPLVTFSPDELSQRIGEISVVVHRGDLQQAMYSRLPAEYVLWGKQCISITQDEHSVSAQFADGTTVTGDLLVGADGINSQVRAQLIGDGPPTYAGYTSYRGVTHFDTSNVGLGEYWGKGRRFGISPLSGGRVYWFVAVSAAAGGHDSPEVEKARLHEMFQGWYGPIEQIIAQTPAEAILRHDIADREPLRAWSQGRITLLGDAAHPMTPNMGQGACQALEDAVVLAECLRAQPNLPQALQNYEAQRIPRTSQIVLQSRRIGAVGQWSNPLACALRNTIVRMMAPIQAKSVETVVGFQV